MKTEEGKDNRFASLTIHTLYKKYTMLINHPVFIDLFIEAYTLKNSAVSNDITYIHQAAR